MFVKTNREEYIMKVKIENRFLKEVELIRRTAQDKKMFWLISPQNYGSLFCISLTESKHMGEDEFLFSFNENEREIKNRQIGFKEELAEKYLHEVYPDYTGEEEDEYEGEEKFPIPENMNQDFFESAEYEYYVETAKALIKRIQEHLNKPENEKIYVIDKQNHLLVSYGDKTKPADDSEWGQEYARTLRRFEVLKAKLNVSREHAIDTYDQLTESDTRILDKLYHTHELNRIVCLGMYYVLIEDRFDYFVNPDGTLKRNVVFEKYGTEDRLMTRREKDGVIYKYGIAWDDKHAYKILEYEEKRVIC